jgi:hypothetical protein
MSNGLHLEYLLFWSDFNKTWNFLDIFFEKYSNINFHKNASSGSPVVPWGQTDRETAQQTDITQLIVAICNFSKALKTKRFGMACET